MYHLHVAEPFRCIDDSTYRLSDDSEKRIKGLADQPEPSGSDASSRSSASFFATLAPNVSSTEASSAGLAAMAITAAATLSSRASTSATDPVASVTGNRIA